ncbi:HlyD family secretion protein [Silvibacterium dinghuense]|uniref:HlyD family secretion protein n=1 Tax=Silvibacterium dinghuense TaxID=1560006 RepID=A0A4Q1SDA5_9BACT|nr:HlyD family secretion protein [Silvibacterium dinghuense]RXS95206.1 HlyD family secretion protein [Silvibacterium dinghuense]GGH11530.1 multidrug resistance protein [Silvibacterium dinghuense]
MAEQAEIRSGIQSAIRSWMIPVVVLAVAALLLLTIRGRWLFWQSGRGEQSTDDAYVRADVTPLSTRISGTVRKVNVGDYQPVKAGQVLMELEDSDYGAELEETKAALAASEAALADNQDAKRVADAQIEAAKAGVQQAEASVEAAQAGIQAVKPELERALLEQKRQDALYSSQAATHQTIEQVAASTAQLQAKLANSQADLAKAQAAEIAARSAVMVAERQRLALDTKDRSYRADIAAKQSAITVSQVNLGYTKIASPEDGFVSERHVFVGQLVTPGTQMIDVVNQEPWIQANFLETQLAHMREGDRVDVRVDSFPGVKLHGHVARISPASGSQFALLPPDNATGNFTKVVQRIPVKVVLDGDEPEIARLRPGMSAVVTVHPNKEQER